MIYSGFPCIGKSTLAEKHHLLIIDLESSMLFVDGKRPDNWEKIYINYAEDLNRQGFDVFVSLNRWAEHRYNTIEANEKCLKYIINHEDSFRGK